MLKRNSGYIFFTVATAALLFYLIAPALIDFMILLFEPLIIGIALLYVFLIASIFYSYSNDANFLAIVLFGAVTVFSMSFLFYPPGHRYINPSEKVYNKITAYLKDANYEKVTKIKVQKREKKHLILFKIKTGKF